jgi:hypothetical protein
LTEVQELYLSKFIDREFLVRATSLLQLLSSVSTQDEDYHSSLSDLYDEISTIYGAPPLQACIDRAELLEELNIELEELEDSEVLTEAADERITDLRDEIYALQDDSEFADSNPCGEISNAWIVTRHLAECPTFRYIQDEYPSSAVPLLEIADVHIWVSTEYNLQHCDWLRLMVQERIPKE